MKIMNIVAIIAIAVTSTYAQVDGSISSGAQSAETKVVMERMSTTTPAADVGSIIAAKPVVVMPHELSPGYWGALGRIYRQNVNDPTFIAGDPTTDPTAYREVLQIKPEYVMASNNGFKLWGGTNNATGNFANETGMMLGFPFAFDRHGETFALADVRVTIRENGNPMVLNQVITYKNGTYGQARGVKDGNVLDLATPSSAPVNQLNLVIGVAYTVNSMATVGPVKSHIIAAAPFRVDVTAELLAPDGQTVIARKTQSSSTIPLTPNARITITKMDNGMVKIGVANDSGLSYRVQRTSSLGSAWSEDVGSVDSQSTVTVPSSGKNYYRLVH